MKITIQNYIIEVDTVSKDRFNLYKTVTAKKKGTEEEYQREDNMAWGITLDRALNIMINDKMDSKEDVIELEKYLNIYKATVSVLLSKIKEILK